MARRAKHLRQQSGKEIYAVSELDKPSTINLIKISFWRPVKMLLTEPVVSVFTVWVSFAWGILLLFFSSVVQTFESAYGFNILSTRLVQLAIRVGALIATVINPIQDRLFLQSARRNSERPGKPIAEARLYFAIPGSLLFTAGLFWYGWTCRQSVHWIVPTIAITAVGIGIYSIYLGVVNYLTDAYEKFAASALLAASLGRNSFGAFLPLASQPLFNDLGFGWAGSLLGFIGLALSVAPVVLLFKGPAIRARSPSMREAGYDDDAEEEEQMRRTNSYGHKHHGPTERRKISLRRQSLPVW